jgi:hypothetical protein
MGGEAMNCLCGSVLPETVLCSEHHKYFQSGRELAAVSRVLRSCWPVKSSFADVDRAVVENARDRGVEVDALLSRYAEGKLDKVPAGTREDAKELFFKAKEWVDAALKAGPIRSQVILSAGGIAGMCDFIVAGPMIVDLKATYDIEAYYPIQLGLYGLLYEEQHRQAVEGLGILHVTARLAKPRWIPLDVDECKRDAKLIRDTWMMAQRRTP